MHILLKKYAILLLDIFTKIYQARDQYPLIIKSLSDGINIYKLPLLGYEITDQHLSRGFITSRKPNTGILYTYIKCAFSI